MHSRTSHSHSGYSARLSRIFMLWFGTLQSFSCAGLIFGFTALTVALKKEGQYAELCSQANRDCSARDLQFSLIYSIGSSAFFAGFLLHGWILDRYGPRIGSVFGTSCIVLGTLFLAFSNSKGFDAFIPAFTLIGFGGPGVHLAWFHVSNLFEQRELVRSCVVGAFVAGALVYVVFLELLLSNIVDRQSLLLYHAAFLCAIILVALRLWPNTRFTSQDCVYLTSMLTLSYVVIPRALEGPCSAGDDMNLGTHTHARPVSSVNLQQSLETVQVASPGSSDVSDYINGSDEKSDQSIIPTQTFSPKSIDIVTPHHYVVPVTVTDPTDNAAEILTDMPVSKQLQSKEYFLIQLFQAVHTLRFNFYLGTSIQQLNSIGDTHTKYEFYLNLALPLAFVTVPFLGRLLEGSLYHGFIFCNTCALIYGVFALISILKVQFITFIFLALFRVSLFACLYEYIVKEFGFASFGRISGLCLFVSAILSLLQYPLVIIVDKLCGGDFFIVNLSMTVAVVPPLYYVIEQMRHGAQARRCAAKRGTHCNI